MRGIITLVFDDGYEAVFRQVVPFLNEHGIPAVFAIPLHTQALVAETGQAITAWSEWLSVRQHGHELAAHSVSHRDLTSISANELQSELQQPVGQLGATTLVYPGGAHNDAVVEAAKKVYAAARTTTYGWQTHLPPDPWRLKTVNYTKDNWSLTKANLRALAAWAANRWLIETYHLIDPAEGGVDTPASSMHHSVPLNEFKRHIEFIQKFPLAIKTINEVISRRHN